MFKTKRAYREDPRHDDPAEYPESHLEDDDFLDHDIPENPLGEELRSKVPTAFSARKRQSAAPDGATIRQQFDTVRRYAAEPGAATVSQPIPAVADEPSRLLIGRDITFRGEISDCKSLVVEGTVAANAKCHSVQIQESGFYDGEIEAETIEVSGRIEGKVHVRGRLTIRAAGRVHGEITYGELDIAAGGQISGEIQHEPAPTAVTETAAVGETAAATQPDVAPFDLSEPPLPQAFPSPTEVGPQMPAQTAANEAEGPTDADESAWQREETFAEADTEPMTVGAAGDRL
jgi:cytoskeletal protein CcmA (bactofilin family)